MWCGLPRYYPGCLLIQVPIAQVLQTLLTVDCGLSGVEKTKNLQRDMQLQYLIEQIADRGN